jgi:transposase-like protein
VIDTARCPRCHRVSHSPSQGKDRWYCHHCKLEFESTDDGDVGYGRPEKRLEGEERKGAS